MKYTQGERVIYNKKKAKVVTGWQALNSKPQYKIEITEGPHRGMHVVATEDKLEAEEFKDSDYGMIPPKIYAYGIDPETNCPICGCAWKKTEFNKIVWYDCTYCKKTKEEIMKNPKAAPYNLNEYFD